jgi:hypothetical protein
MAIKAPEVPEATVTSPIYRIGTAAVNPVNSKFPEHVNWPATTVIFNCGQLIREYVPVTAVTSAIFANVVVSDLSVRAAK